MRILCLTSRLPYPPDRGDRLRAFHFIEHLAAAHELTLVSFIVAEAEREHIAPLLEYCQAVHVVQKSGLSSALTAVLNLWRPQPLQTLYYRSAEMRHLVDRLLAEEPFQAAYVHLFRMTPYVADHDHLYRVVDLTDVISAEIERSMPYRSLLWRLVYQLEGPRITRFERAVADRFEESWLIADADRALLAEQCPTANIRVVPNGVDLDYFRPLSVRPLSASLVFVGHMQVFHNIDAARYLVEEVLPLVQAEIPGCVLTLVGADPAPEVQALGERPSVTVTGFVDDLNRYLNEAAIFVAPLRFAAGVQNKVLEAMAAGRPVVTTTLVNQGLRATPERDLLLADDPVGLAGQIITLFRDEPRRQQIGLAARQFVQEHFSWEYAARRMAQIEANLNES